MHTAHFRHYIRICRSSTFVRFADGSRLWCFYRYSLCRTCRLYLIIETTCKYFSLNILIRIFLCFQINHWPETVFAAPPSNNNNSTITRIVESSPFATTVGRRYTLTSSNSVTLQGTTVWSLAIFCSFAWCMLYRNNQSLIKKNRKELITHLSREHMRRGFARHSSDEQTAC